MGWPAPSPLNIRMVKIVKKEDFERQVNELVPKPDPQTTSALFAFGQELDAESECDSTLELLNSLEFISRHFDPEVLQNAYEIIRHGSAALPEELVAASVFLQDGDTPEHVARQVSNGYLMCFYTPKGEGEISPLAICSITENGKQRVAYTAHFGSFVPEDVFSGAREYARQHGISVAEALQYAAVDGSVSPAVCGARKIMSGYRMEVTEALCDIFACCPAVAARISFDADQEQVSVEYNPLWLELRQQQEPVQDGMQQMM